MQLSSFQGSNELDQLRDAIASAWSALQHRALVHGPLHTNRPDGGEWESRYARVQTHPEDQGKEEGIGLISRFPIENSRTITINSGELPSLCHWLTKLLLHAADDAPTRLCLQAQVPSRFALALTNTSCCGSDANFRWFGQRIRNAFELRRHRAVPPGESAVWTVSNGSGLSALTAIVGPPCLWNCARSE